MFVLVNSLAITLYFSLPIKLVHRVRQLGKALTRLRGRAAVSILSEDHKVEKRLLQQNAYNFFHLPSNVLDRKTARSLQSSYAREGEGEQRARVQQSCPGSSSVVMKREAKVYVSTTGRGDKAPAEHEKGTIKLTSFLEFQVPV